MYPVEKLLPRDQFDQLINLLPTPRNKRLGRKRSCTKEALVCGILQVLKFSVPWNKLYPCGASSSSCYRYLQEIQRRGLLKETFKFLQKGKTDITECSLDTTSRFSFRFSSMADWDGRHRRMVTKISLLTDKNGLPADVLFGDGRDHDGSFVDDHFKNTRGRRKKIVNLDKIYVSLDRRRELRKKGTYVNMKTRVGDYIHKRGPHFKLKVDKYRVRFLIEKSFAWIENFKRCKYRVDYKAAMFKSFIYLALIIILIRN